MSESNEFMPLITIVPESGLTGIRTMLTRVANGVNLDRVSITGPLQQFRSNDTSQYFSAAWCQSSGAMVPRFRSRHLSGFDVLRLPASISLIYRI